MQMSEANQGFSPMQFRLGGAGFKKNYEKNT